MEREEPKRLTWPSYPLCKELRKLKWEIRDSDRWMREHGFNMKELPRRTTAEIKESMCYKFGKHMPPSYRPSGLQTIMECDEPVKGDVKQNIKITKSDYRSLSKELRRLKWKIRDSSRWLRQHGFKLMELPKKPAFEIYMLRREQFGKHLPQPYKPSKLRTIFEDSTLSKQIPSSEYQPLSKEKRKLKWKFRDSTRWLREHGINLRELPTRSAFEIYMSRSEKFGTHLPQTYKPSKLRTIFERDEPPEDDAKKNKQLVSSKNFRHRNVIIPIQILKEVSASQSVTIMKGKTFNERKQYPLLLPDIMNQHKGRRRGNHSPCVSTQLSYSLADCSSGIPDIMRRRRGRHTLFMEATSFSTSNKNSGIDVALTLNDPLINYTGRASNQRKQTPLQLFDRLNQNLRYRRCYYTPFINTLSRSLTNHRPGILLRSDITRSRRGHHNSLLSVTPAITSDNNARTGRVLELNYSTIKYNDRSSNKCRQDPRQLSDIVDQNKKDRRRHERTMSELSPVNKVLAEDQHATSKSQTRCQKLRSWICRFITDRLLFIRTLWQLSVSWTCRSVRGRFLSIPNWWQLLMNCIIN